MVSLRAIYDGNHLQFLEKVEISAPQEVIVVFLDSLPKITNKDLSNEEIRQYLAKSESFAFLDAEEEDVYTNADLKVKY